MPYTKVNDGDKWKVYKKGPDGKPMGEAMGTHDSEEQAEAQITAINLREQKKEADVIKNGYEEEMMMAGPVSFDELEAAEQAEMTAMEAHKATSQFQMLAKNILHRMDISDKAAALGKLAGDYASRVKAAMSPKMKEAETLLEFTKQFKSLETSFQSMVDTQEPTQESGLFIWKEGDVYHWIAAYSNNYRDDDNPAEIISTQSHKEFDEALAKGEYPMPELWPWHIPYRGGQAYLHAFDESTGFTVAAGTFDKGKEWMAEGMIKAGWEGVSHGMPSEEIERDEKDKTIIVHHRSREISPLPPWAAANKLSFNVIGKEKIMPIPAHKKAEFEKAFGADKVAEIEKALEGRAKEAQEAGIEQKETEAAEQAPTGSPELTQAATPPAPDNQALAQAIASAVMAAMGPVAEEVKALQDQVKELQKTDAQKVAEKAANTPPASLEALTLELIGGSLFSKDTEIDGRSQLARSKPKEAPAKNTQGTGFFFDGWLAGQQQ